MKYFTIETTLGIRYFPDTPDKQFNQFNSYGYKSTDGIIAGYKAYQNWLEKIDRQTNQQMNQDKVLLK